MDLKRKTINGLAWNFVGTSINQAVTFIIGIILARLLSPYEYGLMGMVTIFIILAQPFINSGFSQALIRKTNCTNDDYSTVFIFNLIVGLLFYLLLFLSAPGISKFFKEPQLTLLLRVVSIIILINAASLIQTTILTKEINFKKPAQIILISSIISGSVGIYLAYKGYGVWSLVYKTLTQHITSLILLWSTKLFVPRIVFNSTSFKEMFGFGSNLLISGIIDKLYFNIYNIVIAKFFSAKTLGLYNRADMFKNIISTGFSEIVTKVAFPSLANVQEDKKRMTNYYKRYLCSTMYVTSIMLICLAASSRTLILTLIGEKWIDSIVYLQLLCFVGLFYPLIAMTRVLLYANGRGRMGLKMSILSKIFAIPAIILGIIVGIEAMIIAMIVFSLIEFIINAYYSGIIVEYPLMQQLKDLAPSLFLATFIGSCLFFIDYLLNFSNSVILMLQLLIGITLTVGLSEIFKIREYIFIKQIILEKKRELI